MTAKEIVGGIGALGMATLIVAILGGMAQLIEYMVASGAPWPLPAAIGAMVVIVLAAIVDSLLG